MEEFKNKIQSSLDEFLLSKGFKHIELTNPDKLGLNWNRKSSDGSFDLLSVTFDKHGAKRFSVLINKIDANGFSDPWGQFFPSDKVVAWFLDQRVSVHPTPKGILDVLSKKIFRYLPFAYSSGVEEFISIFHQMEDWWKRGVIGKNMLIQRSVAKIKYPHPNPPPT